MKSLIAALFLLLVIPPVVTSTVRVGQGPTPSQVTLYWDANTETDLAGYYIYRSTISGSQYIRIGTVGVMAQPAFTTPGLGNGTWYFVVTAYNSGGMESGYSNEVSTVISTAPANPKGLRLTILAILAAIWRFVTLRG